VKTADGINDETDLLEDLRRAEGTSNQSWRGECQVCKGLESMSPEVAETVRKVVEGRTIGNERLAKILQGYGYPIGRRAIIRHQNGHTTS